MFEERAFNAKAVFNHEEMELIAAAFKGYLSQLRTSIKKAEQLSNSGRFEYKKTKNIEYFVNGLKQQLEIEGNKILSCI